MVRFMPWLGVYALAYLLGKAMQWMRYRRKVVSKNLHLAFPFASEKEVRKLTRNFYQYFSRVLLESLKGYTTHAKKLKKRYILKNPEVIQQYFSRGKTVVILMAHFNNWEWFSVVLPEILNVNQFALYKPFRNYLIDRFIHHHREKKGMKLYSIEEVGIMVRKALQSPSVMIFLSDQRPARTEFHHAIWTPFFNINTPFPQGAQAVAKKFNLPVVYVSVKEINKGKYLCTFEPILNDVTTENDVMKFYVTLLERDIKKQPSNYVWTHNRWKYLNLNI